MRLASLLLAFVTLCPSVGLAQAPTPAAPNMPACEGSITIVRVSDVQPGMMAKFKEAVAAQQAWYRSVGMADTILLIPMLDRSATGMTYSPNQAMTAHIVKVDGMPSPPHDAAYAAFVALYKASSTIKAEYTTCMPMMM